MFKYCKTSTSASTQPQQLNIDGFLLVEFFLPSAFQLTFTFHLPGRSPCVGMCCTWLASVCTGNLKSLRWSEGQKKYTSPDTSSNSAGSRAPLPPSVSCSKSSGPLPAAERSPACCSVADIPGHRRSNALKPGCGHTESTGIRQTPAPAQNRVKYGNSGSQLNFMTFCFLVFFCLGFRRWLTVTEYQNLRPG